ncbi:MAG: FHA domain-containing protein [Duncaniella sp.]|nr:FHA domain-containing protein [Duncaniella sp.]
MKKVVIGRGHDCDIVIEDTTDVVSRRQAAIAFDIFGRMTIYDLSTNGTFVNGIRVPKPAGVPLRRTDTVNFGTVCEFDLGRVRDPYRGLRVLLCSLLALIVIGLGVLAFYATRPASPAATAEPVPAAPMMVENVLPEAPEPAAEPVPAEPSRPEAKPSTPGKSTGKKDSKVLRKKQVDNKENNSGKSKPETDAPVPTEDLSNLKNL